uniref:hypothetical protein n=1 Tax=Sphingomonas bacterium TaxID=1895847 RepID=UPI00261564EC|nr:hypothetical protein [Sphingomonas bacterium]
MSSNIPSDLYPVAVIQDRYRGTYSNGEWLAICHAGEDEDGTSRIGWLLKLGPGDDDIEAADFWSSPPSWIAVGPTPDQAVANLIAKTAPGIDRGPA